MSFSNMFNNSFIEENYTTEDGTQYKIKIDASIIFKAKLIQYVRQGLRIEKMLIPASLANRFKGTPVSDNGKYVLYTSIPEYLINPDENPQDLIRSFKNWITRFMYHNKSEEEYNALKENRQLAVDVRNNADQMVYQTDKTVTEFGDKLSEEEKSKIETAKQALVEALKGEDIEAIKAKQEELQKELFAVSEKVYKAAAEAQQAAQGGAEGAAPADDNVYEADFTDVDENK